MEDMAMLGAGVLVGLLVLMVVGLLFGALILKLIVKLFEKFSPSYGKSLLVVFLAGLVGFGVYVVLAMLMVGGGATTMDPNDQAAMAAMAGKSLGAMALSFVAYFVIYAGTIHLLIKRPDGSDYGFGRAAIASMMYLVVMTVLSLIAAVILAFVFGAALGGLAAMGGG
jgi:hypothetical protein